MCKRGKRILESEDIFKIVDIFHSCKKIVHIEVQKIYRFLLDAGEMLFIMAMELKQNISEMAQKHLVVLTTWWDKQCANTPEEIYNSQWE